ncbi:MAG: hypothetical protein PQJ59_07105 [Spirochaetales bacterium]|nr:hypothetical protein [Spirochaetales bacterium]
MKKLIFSLILLAGSLSVSFAQSAIWAGNATRGNDDAYPASIRSSGKAAGLSLALPEGTLVQVRNRKNGKTADVTIVSGQGKPGIFLLLNSSAADALDIHTGEVIMVEIEEKSSISNPFLDYSSDPDGFKRNLNEEFLTSPGTNPDDPSSLDVEGEMDKMGYETEEEDASLAEESSPEETAVAALPDTDDAVIEEEELLMEEITVEDPLEGELLVDAGEAETEEIIEENPIVVETPIEETPPVEEPELEELYVPEAEGDFEEIIIATGKDDYDEELDYSSKEEPFLSDDLTADELVKEEPVLEESAPVEEPIVEEAPVLAETEEAPKEEPVIDRERVIYFLTPAELRPPEVEEEEPALPEWNESEGEVLTVEAEEPVAEPEKEGEEEIIFVPQYVESDDLEEYMEETRESGARYVQVALFDKNASEEIYDNMGILQDAFPYLPILLMPGSTENTLRLMVGPVSRDEVGILLYAMKAHGFADAFLNRE